MLKGMIISTFLAGGLLTGAAVALEGSGPRAVEIAQVGKGFTVKCSTEHGVYPYYSEVAKDVDEALANTRLCLTMKIRSQWGE